MADPQKIASTFSIDLQPAGTLQERDHARLTDYLSQSIGPQAADILAEPVTNRDGSRTDWYSHRAGRAISLRNLAEEEAIELRDRLSVIERQMETLAAQLSASTYPDDRNLAIALANCLTVPGEDFIYAVGGEPVLTAWGFTYARKPGYRGGLAKIAPMKAMPAQQAVATSYATAPGNEAESGQGAGQETRHPKGCLPLLLWLILALLIAAILFLLLRACAFGISLPWPGSGFCRQPVAASLIGDLQREMADLENRLLARRDDCARDGLALLGPGEEQVEQLPQDDGIEDRLAKRNAQGGSLQISLVWNSQADLDLSIRCAQGTINYRSAHACGGALDVDSNNGRNTTAQPVENIFWRTEEDIPPGGLPIDVTLFSMRADPGQSVPYTVRILRKNGDEVLSEKIITGTATPGEMGQPVTIGNANP